MSRLAFAFTLAVMLFGADVVEALVTLRGALEGGTELDVDL